MNSLRPEGAANISTDSRDPLRVFGLSLFLQIAAELPFETILQVEQVSRSWRATIQARQRTVWKAVCRRTGVQKKVMAKLEREETAGSSSRIPSHGETSLVRSEHGDEGDVTEGSCGPDAVGWKDVCKDYVELERAWRFGRCRERHITTDGGYVWRFKIDLEENTLIATSRSRSGLEVVDTSTSKLLFTIHDIQEYAHLEFAMGFVIYNVNDGLDVWRTQTAVKRAKPGNVKPKALPRDRALPPTHRPQREPWDPDWQTRRGLLEYYRNIRPPTDCRAFRARIDHEGIDGKERAVLATAGRQAVYIWDLEEEGQMVTIPLVENEEVRYIEFDDDHVFVCYPDQLSIYSRHTLQLVLPLFSTTAPHERREEGPWALKFTLNWGSTTRVTRLPEPEFRVTNSDARYRQSWLASLEAPEVDPYDLGSELGEEARAMTEDLSAAVGPLGLPKDFTACHYTANDLYCTTASGHVIIIRNYKEVLKSPPDELRKVLIANTILLYARVPVRSLSTHYDTDGHVALITDVHVFLLQPTSLPKLPLPLEPMSSSSSRPACGPLRIHSFMSIIREAMFDVSCVQMDQEHLYIVYDVEAEQGESGLRDLFTGETRPAMTFAGRDVLALCVKVWDYSKIAREA